MSKDDFLIGVLGGMGTYATIHLFKQYAEIFDAKKEWERPRILIDNRCTMPSRVRAYLYNERIEELVSQMTESISRIIDSGNNRKNVRILLACNTSHLFLPYIYERCPSASDCIVDIIKTCANKIMQDGIKSIYLLGSEGTIDSGIYQKELQKYEISCTVPDKKDYGMLRDCIEAVKQNQFSDEVREKFYSLLYGHNSCILGCTELPILFEKYCNYSTYSHVYDPIMLGLKEIKEEYENA